MMRIMISLTLSLSIFASNVQAAQVAVTPSEIDKIVDEYIGEAKSSQAGPMHLSVGKQVYLAQAIVGEVIGYTPEDFNMFLFYTIERYIKEPQNREVIFTLLKELRGAISADLFNSKMLREGPQHNIVQGMYRHAAWVLVMYAGFRFAATYLTRGKQFLSVMEKKELELIQRGPYYRLGYRVATNPLAWSTAAGAGIGFWEYLRDRNKTQKHDPIEVLEVVQASLACDLSYRALELQDEYEKFSKDPEMLGLRATRLLSKIEDIGNQAGLLKKQFSRLESLEIGERLFNERMQRFPPAKTWQKFRSNLVQAEQLKDGECRAVSMENLERHFKKLTATLIPYVNPIDLVQRRRSPYEGDPEQVSPLQLRKLRPRSAYEGDPEQVPPLHQLPKAEKAQPQVQPPPKPQDSEPVFRGMDEEDNKE